MLRCIKKPDGTISTDEVQVEKSYRRKANRKLANNKQLKTCFLKLRYKFKLLQKNLIVILYSWLFLNVDPIYARRTIANMVASRTLHRSLLSAVTGNRDGRSERDGMSNAEAIALVAAINSGNNRAIETGLMRQLSPRQQQALDRQLPVPVPVPVPTPFPPVPPVVAAIAAVFAAVAALLAAALAGLNPFQAVFAVFIALIAIIIAILTPPKAKKQAPLIKKLVIKKTVLPFVIPIPYKQKEKEKEIIYKYVKEKKHHEHHDEYEYKFDRVASQKDDQNPLGRRQKVNGVSSWKKIESLLSEQDQLQNLIDDILPGKDDTNALVRRIR